MRTPALLAILDGVGIAEPGAANALTSANAPFLHELFGGNRWPCRLLGASGRDVGLPEGQMGNSEVGHLNIGSGRIINQELTRIDCAIEDGSLSTNEVLCSAFDAASASGATVHFLGLLSDGGVHSTNTHLEALVNMALERGVRRVRIAAFLDGRDVAPTSGKSYVERTAAFCHACVARYPGADVRIGTISGRYYAMDRDKRWERVEKAWRALVLPGVVGSPSPPSIPSVLSSATPPLSSSGISPLSSSSISPLSSSGISPLSSSSISPLSFPRSARESLAAPAANQPEQPPISTPVYPADADPAAVVQASYDAGVTDEFVIPVALGDDGVVDGDALVFFNFRPDRARELTRAFIDPAFEGFVRPVVPQVHYVCMTEYDPVFEQSLGAQVAFPKSFPTNVLADYLASLGLKQLHIAETEKYAHVTFFFNGGVEEPKEGEKRILIPSPKVATYDLQPQMSAPEVTAALVDAIEHDAADVYIVNYANGDMVGHTGVLAAAIEAIEAVDRGLEQVVEAIVAKGGVVLVTADHGNSEQMIDETGAPWTAHTLSPVPLAVIEPPHNRIFDLEYEQPARLADIAPTLLNLMGVPIPPEWTGRSLLISQEY
jgi:2,3-bisphosphoglycerate-independent phosphoglycerate mutase